MERVFQYQDEDFLALVDALVDSDARGDCINIRLYIVQPCPCAKTGQDRLFLVVDEKSYSEFALAEELYIAGKAFDWWSVVADAGLFRWICTGKGAVERDKTCPDDVEPWQADA